MICFYIMLVHVVRNRLVLVLLKSVPLLISYDNGGFVGPQGVLARYLVSWAPLPVLIFW